MRSVQIPWIWAVVSTMFFRQWQVSHKCKERIRQQNCIEKVGLQFVLTKIRNSNSKLKLELELIKF